MCAAIGIVMHRRFAVSALLALGLGGCGDDATQAAPAAPAVTISQPVRKEIVEWDEYTGRFGAVDSVEVRARVSGYLSSVNFKAGQDVKKDDLLFVIDQRPFRIALDQAEAQFVQAQTRATLAGRELARAQSLLDSKNVSEQFYDQRAQNKLDADAALKAAHAAVATAKLNLEFSEVRAPVSGRVSREMVTVGNLVSGGGTGATLLTTIVSLDPIHFYFDVAETEYLKYKRLSQAEDGHDVSSAGNQVALQLADEDGWPHHGTLDFLDNQFDPATGTLRMRAVLANPSGLLSPGLFARIRLPGSARYVATLLPDEAIGTDQTQRLAYQVGADNLVTPQPVVLGPRVDGLRVVRAGLAPDAWVITKGLQRARPGAAVTPTREPLAPEAAPGAVPRAVNAPAREGQTREGQTP